MTDLLSDLRVLRLHYETIRAELPCRGCEKKNPPARTCKLDIWEVKSVDDDGVHVHCADCKGRFTIFAPQGRIDMMKLFGQICKEARRVPRLKEALELYDHHYRVKLMEENLKVQRDIKRILGREDEAIVFADVLQNQS